jgi:hypothetical protein
MTFLAIDSTNKIQFQPQRLVGKSIAVLGITGSGKTNTAAVLIEELLVSGLPLTIIDIEGEYWGLKEKFEILVAGRSPQAELEIGPDNAGQLAKISVERGLSVILDLSDFTQSEVHDLLVHYITSLWKACSSAKRPYYVVLEEAHEFIPQGNSTLLKQFLTRIALRGRKRGLGFILISQRSAKVEKDVLTQASLLFLHKVVHPIDLKIYKDLIPLIPAQVEEIVRKLEPGEAIIVHDHLVDVIHIRLRHTFHAGFTPLYEPVTHPTLRKLDETTLQELKTLIATISTPSAEDSKAKLEQRIKDLEDVLSLKEQEIQHLKDQVSLLSKLRLSIDNWPHYSTTTDTQTLRVEQAIVQSVVTGEEGLRIPLEKETVSTSTNNDSTAPKPSLSPFELRKFATLQRRIQKLPKLHRAILHLLAEHEGTAMTVQTMATWLSFKESTIRSRPPLDLIKMKLITRTRSKYGYQYVSSVSSYLRNEFPRTDPDILIEKLLG